MILESGSVENTDTDFNPLVGIPDLSFGKCVLFAKIVATTPSALVWDAIYIVSVSSLFGMLFIL